ncbi:VOC family protein [Actinomadura rupiterrae]|uniref:VOC family protein n=1 Tax=Actinomadura rupiterrae TaxID=559627 RepID=UPI0020A48866|nr:VOC family protein [Actinomadura rupiterrae]MCP2336912.1 putative glyoxalase superfamily protein PhnB [Actinomadura rupiterrae]
MSETKVWPCFSYPDARAAIDFLVEAFGLVERAAYTDDRKIVHAQLDWPAGGGVMIGTSDPANECSQPVGGGSVYFVTGEPDALYERATAAGAKIVRGLRDEDYGSRGFVARDLAGNLWSFGTYGGE